MLFLHANGVGTSRAVRINGQMPELSHDGALSDFYSIGVQAPEDGVSKIISLVRDRIPNALA